MKYLTMAIALASGAIPVAASFSPKQQVQTLQRCGMDLGFAGAGYGVPFSD